jgi:stage III sporulation protein AA
MLKILDYLPDVIRNNILIEEERLNEIRIRMDKPVFYVADSREYVVKENDKPVIADKIMIDNLILKFCSHSKYAYEYAIKNGYLTVEGGHRIGICGQAVIIDDTLGTIDNISSLNIRISHEIIGSAKMMADMVLKDNKFSNTLIISPPGFGKTTVLRDLIRILSNKGKNISVIDERGEISGTYKGSMANDLGNRTDVMYCMPKVKGINMVLRSMKPDIIAVDEIGTTEDVRALLEVYKSGVNILATAHGIGKKDIKENTMLHLLVENNIFRNYFSLNKDRSVNAEC